jgi:hypothetical protein
VRYRKINLTHSRSLNKNKVKTEVASPYLAESSQETTQTSESCGTGRLVATYPASNFSQTKVSRSQSEIRERPVNRHNLSSVT